SSRLRRVRVTTFSPPVWSPDSKRFAVSGRGILTLAAGGGHVRKLGVAGQPVAWSRNGDLFITSGSSERNVLWSSGGRRPGRLLFRMAKNQSIVAVDVASLRARP